MPSVPTTPAAISAALAALDGAARLQAAGAILDRLDAIADRDANRPLFDACDALLEALPRDDTRTLDRWLAGREPASRPSLYLRARLAHAAGQLTAAAGHWDALFRGTPPADANVLLLYARVLADVGRFSDAAERLRHALRCRPPYSFYPRVRTLLDRLWQEAPPADRQARVAVIGSSTTSLVVQVLRALCFRDGVNAEFYEGPYGTYRQEILDRDSGLYRFKPGLTFVLRTGGTCNCRLTSTTRRRPSTRPSPSRWLPGRRSTTAPAVTSCTTRSICRRKRAMTRWPPGPAAERA